MGHSHSYFTLSNTFHNLFNVKLYIKKATLKTKSVTIDVTYLSPYRVFLIFPILTGNFSICVRKMPKESITATTKQ